VARHEFRRDVHVERGEEEHTVRLSASDREILLVRWINELVFVIRGEGFVPVGANMRIRGAMKEATLSKRALPVLLWTSRGTGGRAR
jgi:SHS2 domain-containing protein